MEAVKGSVSVHTRISKTKLMKADTLAVREGTSRSQIIDRALAMYFKTSTKTRKTR